METNTIKTARLFNKNGKDLVSFNGNTVVSASQVTGATGLKSNFDLLVGGTISAEFYAVDEIMRNEAKCTKADMIVKDFTIELPEELLAYKRAAAFGTILKAA